jgi:hypothetical protein
MVCCVVLDRVLNQTDINFVGLWMACQTLKNLFVSLAIVSGRKSWCFSQLFNIKLGRFTTKEGVGGIHEQPRLDL